MAHNATAREAAALLEALAQSRLCDNHTCTNGPHDGAGHLPMGSLSRDELAAALREEAPLSYGDVGRRLCSSPAQLQLPLSAYLSHTFDSLARGMGARSETLVLTVALLERLQRVSRDCHQRHVRSQHRTPVHLSSCPSSPPMVPGLWGSDGSCEGGGGGISSAASSSLGPPSDRAAAGIGSDRVASYKPTKWHAPPPLQLGPSLAAGTPPNTAMEGVGVPPVAAGRRRRLCARCVGSPAFALQPQSVHLFAAAGLLLSLKIDNEALAEGVPQEALAAHVARLCCCDPLPLRVAERVMCEALGWDLDVPDAQWDAVVARLGLCQRHISESSRGSTSP